MATNDLMQLEAHIEALLNKLTPAQVKKLSRAVATELRLANARRIKHQVTPDMAPFAKRKRRRPKRHIQFIYETGGTRHLKSWHSTAQYITGFDLTAGGIRTFKKDRIVKYLRIDKGVSSDMLSNRQGMIKQKMFRKLIRSRWLKAEGSASSAVVKFNGIAERIARIHHFGERAKVHPRGPEIDYPERQLLGITSKDFRLIQDTLIDHLAKFNL